MVTSILTVKMLLASDESAQQDSFSVITQKSPTIGEKSDCWEEICFYLFFSFSNPMATMEQRQALSKIGSRLRLTFLQSLKKLLRKTSFTVYSWSNICAKNRATSSAGGLNLTGLPAHANRASTHKHIHIIYTFWHKSTFTMFTMVTATHTHKRK